jgi:hypothetical protein
MVMVVVVLKLDLILYSKLYLKELGLFTYLWFVYIFSDAWNAFGLFTTLLRTRREYSGVGVDY